MIYFVTAREVGRVKIGFTDDPWTRLNKMQSDSPVTLVLERLVTGDTVVERNFHADFAAERVRGEWFALTPEIEAIMLTLPVAAKAARVSLTRDVATKAGISVSYASQIVNRRRRPPIPLALHIAVTAGFRHPCLIGMSDAMITQMSRDLPWTRPSDQRAVA